jgi:DNA-binding GntR family transcriptional regulator
MQEAAVLQLRDMIAHGKLRPGDHIHQEMVAIDLGSSIVPVREALKILEAEGQVIYRPNHGYEVTQLNLKELTETFRIRELLENEAIARAVPKLNEQDFHELYEAILECKLFSEKNDLVALTAANRRFHFTLFGAADMPHLTNLIRMLWHTTDPFPSLFYKDEEYRQQTNDEHDAMWGAIREGNVELTIRLQSEHRAEGFASFRQMLIHPSPPRDEEQAEIQTAVVTDID